MQIFFVICWYVCARLLLFIYTFLLLLTRPMLPLLHTLYMRIFFYFDFNRMIMDEIPNSKCTFFSLYFNLFPFASRVSEWVIVYVLIKYSVFFYFSLVIFPSFSTVCVLFCVLFVYQPRANNQNIRVNSSDHTSEKSKIEYVFAICCVCICSQSCFRSVTLSPSLKSSI